LVDDENSIINPEILAMDNDQDVIDMDQIRELDGDSESEGNNNPWEEDLLVVEGEGSEEESENQENDFENMIQENYKEHKEAMEE